MHSAMEAMCGDLGTVALQERYADLRESLEEVSRLLTVTGEAFVEHVRTARAPGAGRELTAAGRAQSRRMSEQCAVDVKRVQTETIAPAQTLLDERNRMQADRKKKMGLFEREWGRGSRATGQALTRARWRRHARRWRQEAGEGQDAIA